MESPHPSVPRPKSAFFAYPQAFASVYAQGRQTTVEALTDAYPRLVEPKQFEEHAANLRDVEVIFSTWGMAQLKAEQLDQLPALKAVFYAAGTVQSFARPFLERGIPVVSAWQANAVPVAEFTVAQIILSSKGYFRNARELNRPEIWKTGFRGRGNFGETIAILGAGAIGRRVIERLRPYHLKIIVFDPFLKPSVAQELGVELVSLPEAFQRAYVVTNHLADLPATKKMLHGELFAQMRPDATFINTGRGATVDEASFLETMQARPDLTALLDVTMPEPPAAGSLFYTLPNIRMSSHIAGSIGDEVIHMADLCIHEFEAWTAGKPLEHSVSLQMLESMA